MVFCGVRAFAKVCLIVNSFGSLCVCVCVFLCDAVCLCVCLLVCLLGCSFAGMCLVGFWVVHVIV